MLYIYFRKETDLKVGFSSPSFVIHACVYACASLQYETIKQNRFVNNQLNIENK